MTNGLGAYCPTGNWSLGQLVIGHFQGIAIFFPVLQPPCSPAPLPRSDGALIYQGRDVMLGKHGECEMSKKLSGIALVFILILSRGGFSFLARKYFDWLWFEELGKARLFTTILYAKSSLGSAMLLLSFFFLYLNLWYANSGPSR